ncbi:MAG: NFACT family protein [Christensenellaceae bacterium]|jgi:predicted ribosome quality control (RQC) complex YloA/Tae2 family protein|nr:NFACT family protein [Christensenellaceae bacterium]
MPNDYITLKALTAELNEVLESGRVNRVTCDGSDVVLSLRAKGANRTLVMSADPTYPRIYLANVKPESTGIPSSFCMLLRKHLTNGAIEKIEILNHDRIISLSIIAKDELRDSTLYHLVIEIMGGGSNILLLDADFILIGALKLAFEDTNTRQIIPGIKYDFPITTKLSVDAKEAIQLIKDNLIENPSKLLTLTSGLSKESAAEIFKRTNAVGIDAALQEFILGYNSKAYNPVIALDDTDNPLGYYMFKYSASQETVKWQETKTLSDAIEIYYSAIEKEQKRRRDTKELRSIIKRAKVQMEKRLAFATDTAEKGGVLNDLLCRAEILKCNAHRLSDIIKGGANKITCHNYYTDESIDLELDLRMAAKANIAAYYKKYNKLKGAIAYANKEIIEIRHKLDYISSIEATVATSDSKEEFDEIKAEISDFLGVKATNNKKLSTKKIKRTRPLMLVVDEFPVYIGKNNYQNDVVTFEIADSSDIWLHVKNYHGAHAIIKTNRAIVPNTTLIKVASYVAFFSQANSANKVEVDYTTRKNVKKLGRPGLVSYVDYKTLIVNPVRPNL